MVAVDYPYIKYIMYEERQITEVKHFVLSYFKYWISPFIILSSLLSFFRTFFNNESEI